MKYFILGVCLGLLLCMSCCSYNINLNKIDSDYTVTPEIFLLPECDIPSTELIHHIIQSTNRFCRQTDRHGVKKISICHNEERNHTNVIYICF